MNYEINQMYLKYKKLNESSRIELKKRFGYNPNSGEIPFIRSVVTDNGFIENANFIVDKNGYIHIKNAMLLSIDSLDTFIKGLDIIIKGFNDWYEGNL